MSYVSEFLIDPVLRQARRFSRSQAQGERINSQQQQQSVDGTDESRIDGIAQPVGMVNQGDANALDSGVIVHGDVLTSSPVEEDGGLEGELEALEEEGTSAISNLSRSRVNSLRRIGNYIDDDVSDNPLFGIPGRFRRTQSGTSQTGQNISSRMSPAEGPSRSSTLDMSNSEPARRSRNSSLPADDGMGDLRQQIILIQGMETSGENKARMMHQLLTRGYTQTQELHHAKNLPQPTIPAEMISQERPTTPGSLSTYLWQMNGTTENVPPSAQHTFQLSPNDLRRTYAPPDPQEIDEDGTVRVKEDNGPALGCIHYKRNVKLQCSACSRWYTCRLCHDENEDHILNRKATKNMLCMLCGCAQGAGEDCVGCGERTAWYYCSVCKLWDDDPNKSIYHCNDCGICRKGRGIGKDFFHCMTCAVCISIANRHSHKCIERVSDCDCPICGEYMFTSPRPVVFMLCGHSIHQACYYEHMKSSYKCPICSKSTVNMETQFRNLDRQIDAQPMPPHFQDTKAMVSCNDCYAKSAVKYHWLGLKCAICDSYNTAQLSILSDPAVEVPSIEVREPEVSVQPTQPSREGALAIPATSGPSRTRRHSSYTHSSNDESSRFAPYRMHQRLGRSASPVRSQGMFESSPSEEVEDAIYDEDHDSLAEESRGWTSIVQRYDDMDEDEDDGGFSDEDSEDDDDDDDDDNPDDRFQLLGHR